MVGSRGGGGCRRKRRVLVGAADVAKAAKRFANATAWGAGAAAGVGGAGGVPVEGCAGGGQPAGPQTRCWQPSCPAGLPLGRAVSLMASGIRAAAEVGGR